MVENNDNHSFQNFGPFELAFCNDREQVLDDEELKAATEADNNQDGGELTEHFPVSDETSQI